MMKWALNALKTTKQDAKGAAPLAKGAAPLAEAIRATQQPRRLDRAFSPQTVAKALKAADGGDFTELMGLAIQLEDRDAQWRTVLQSRKLAVTRLPIRVEAAMDDERHLQDADLARDILVQNGIRRLLFDLLDGLSKGFAVVEVAWLLTARRWMPARFVYRDPRLFCSTPQEPERIFWQQRAASEMGVDAKAPFLAGRYIVHRPMLSSIPAPQAGLCRLGIWLWMFKSFVIRDWVEFIEGFGQPLRVGTYPPQSDEAAIATLRRAVLELGRAAGVIIPLGMDLRFEERAAHSNGDLHLAALNYFDQQASKLVLGQTATTDAISGGHAVSKEHNEVRSDIRDADAADLAETLERDLIKIAIDLNHGPPPDGLYPKISISQAHATDIDALSNALQKLVPLGLRVEQSVVRDRIGLPDPPEDIAPELLLTASPNIEPALQTALHSKESSPLVARLSRQAPVDGMIDLVRAMIDEAAAQGLGLDAVQEQLLTLYRHLEIEDVAELIAKANMASFLAGMAGEDKKKHLSLNAVEPLSLPFDEAIAFFKDKVNMPSKRYDDLWRGEHARGFMVAGALRDDLLTDFHQSLGKAIEQGTTLAQFRKEFDDIVAKYGWGYKGGRDWRTRVIFETNLDQSFMAGKWQQIERLKDRRPYLRYVHGASADPRPQHQAWHGLVLPVDHAFWTTHYPKNGWGCTCSVVQLSDDDLKRYGFQISEDPTIALDAKTGCPVGIDKGFDYNVGIAHVGRRLSDEALAAWELSQKQAKAKGRADSGWRSLTKGDWQSFALAEKLTPRPTKARLAAPEPKTTAEAEALLTDILGGAEASLHLPGSLVVYVNAASLVGHFAKNIERARLLPLLPELLCDPDEIWQSFEQSEKTGRIALRHYIVRAVALDRERYLLLVAQVKRGRFEAWTMTETNRLAAINVRRRGKLLYGKQLPPS